jgi:hypothetical protein
VATPVAVVQAAGAEVASEDQITAAARRQVRAVLVARVEARHALLRPRPNAHQSSRHGKTLSGDRRPSFRNVK